MSKSQALLLSAITTLLLIVVGTRHPSSAAAPAVYINEMRVDSAGTNWEFVEIQGPGGTDLSGLSLVGIESDIDDPAVGSIDVIIDLSGQSIPADGIWVGMNAEAQAEHGMSGDMTIPSNSFEESSASYFLVDGLSVSAGFDLDIGDDGAFDLQGWASTIDSLSIVDTIADYTYGSAAVVGPDSAFLPAGAYRCPDAPLGSFGSNFLDYSSANGTPGSANDCPTVPIGSCGDDATLISQVQGSGPTTPVAGQTVNVEGVVVGDFQADDGDPFGTDLSGFFLQEEAADADGNPATSDGIFVYVPTAEDVQQGDIVRVQGEAQEYVTSFGASSMTQLAAADILLCGDGTTPTPVELVLPVGGLSDLEQLEGMLVNIPQQLVIAGYDNFDYRNEIVLATPGVAGRPFQPTAYIDPDADPDAIDEAYNLMPLSRVTLDDGRTSENPPLLRHPDGSVFSLDHRFRGGDLIDNVTGVLAETFGAYRIQPTAAATYTATNPRAGAPQFEHSRLHVASLNVLNYFLTLDDGNPICGPNQDLACRGADDAQELTRQRDKILAALLDMEADVFGLVELENTTGVEPLADLVQGLNDALGADVYDYVDTGAIGADAIKVGLIYKTTTVSPVGDYAALDDSAFTDPLGYKTQQNRPALAQTFHSEENDQTFTVVVNHFKSKGFGCDPLNDDDPYEGRCNQTRALAADHLVKWLSADPTDSGSGNVLIIGDLNAYRKEDPIEEIIAGPDDTMGTADDYVDLLQQFQGGHAYSYNSDGLLGALDYALASGDLAAMVTNAAIWHINADEPDLFDYDTGAKPTEQQAFYEDNAYRASDHDSVVVGLFPVYRARLPFVVNGPASP